VKEYQTFIWYQASPPRWRLVGRLLPCDAPISHDVLVSMLEPLLNKRRHAAVEQYAMPISPNKCPDIGRMRVNICRQRSGFKACIRLVPEDTTTLATLDLPAELSRVQDYHQGLIVISGPNGHGKTTTLAALVDLYNETRPAHIIYCRRSSGVSSLTQARRHKSA